MKEPGDQGLMEPGNQELDGQERLCRVPGVLTSSLGSFSFPVKEEESRVASRDKAGQGTAGGQ
jgi:hypothetical protein